MGVRAIQVCLLVLILVGLPLAGVLLAGQPVVRYLEFPPVTRYVEQAPFSWIAFAGLFLFVASIVLPFVAMVLGAPRSARVYLMRDGSFPWWGWLGAGIVLVAWGLAWTRFPWLAALQPFTFTPIWIGYIVVVNALTFSRTGRCLMIDRVGYFLALFPLSAVFWWFFEYLNRFVQNWYYVGVSEFSHVEYFVHATLPFSTVLPAVLSTVEYLESIPRLDDAFRELVVVDVPHPMAIGWPVFILSSLGLLGLGIWPQYLFPLVWISPVLVITSLQAVMGEETIFSRLRDGDWRPIWIPALAGLICGFFWEMWNSHSLAHWEYAIPHVHRFQIFEMPLLGYAGYLPFGLECVVVAGLLAGGRLGRAGSH